MKQIHKSMDVPALVPERTIHDLARFRYTLRKFLRFSENAARDCGVTPQQHQLMLGVAGFTGRGDATISELAEFLQEKNHSVVGLVERAQQSGLIRRKSALEDRRSVVVSLTARGNGILSRLSLLHEEEVRRLRNGFFKSSPSPQNSRLQSGAQSRKKTPS